MCNFKNLNKGDNKMIDFVFDDDEKLSAADKLRNMVNWINAQDENFNDHMKTVKTIEEIYDLCQTEGFEFADDLYCEEDDIETRDFAKKINKALGFRYYCL